MIPQFFEEVVCQTTTNFGGPFGWPRSESLSTSSCSRYRVCAPGNSYQYRIEQITSLICTGARIEPSLSAIGSIFVSAWSGYRQLASPAKRSF